MSAISNFLSFLRSAIYAIDVRDGIADAIEQCYNDVNNPTLKTEALEAALQTKIDEGEMAALTIGDHTITAAKLAQGVIDNTLATSGAAADAKKTGDEITAIKADLGDLVGGEPVTRYTALSHFGTWTEKKSINADGHIRANDDVMHCTEYLSTDHYAIEGALNFRDRTDNNGFFVSIAFYNSNKTFVSRNNYVSGTQILVSTIPSDVAYFRINLVYKINNTAVEAVLANVPVDKLDVCYLEESTGIIDELQDDVETLQGQVTPLVAVKDTMDLPVSYVSSVMKTPGQGLAKVGNNFVISQAGTDSYDSAGSTVKIQVYDSAFANVGFMWHDLGHGSNICYNPTFDVFLMGNGAANVSPRLDILLNASANVQSAIDGNEPEYLFGGSNVMSIYLTKNGTELLAGADGALWCVGGNDRLVFISLRRSSDKARVFYLAMLGVGSTDFSQDSAGYGTFVSGKSDSELNGTLKILKEYQPISNSDIINSTQGVTYDKGRLIVSYSTTACLLCKLALYDAGYKITDKYKVAFYNANGTEATCEPEGVEKVGDGHYYCATTKGVIDFYC